MSWGRLFIVGSLLAVGSVAAAQDASDDASRAQARKHFQEGTKAFDLGHFEEAIRDYEAAYRLRDDPVLLYNLAQAHRLAGHNGDALRLYKVYLNRLPKATNRAEVLTKIAALDELVRQEKAMRSIPPDHPIRAGAGAPDVASSSPSPSAPPLGAEPARAPEPKIEPTPMGTAPTVAPSTTGSAAAAADRAVVPGRAKKLAGIGAAAGGVALVAAGIAFGVLAKQSGDAVTAAARAHQSFDPSKESAGHLDTTLEGVFIGVGAAAVVTGGVLYLLGHREARHPRSLALTPQLSPTRASLVVQGSF